MGEEQSGLSADRAQADVEHRRDTGSLQMARAVNDPKLSSEILENALEGAITLAGED